MMPLRLEIMPMWLATPCLHECYLMSMLQHDVLVRTACWKQQHDPAVLYVRTTSLTVRVVAGGAWNTAY